MMMLEIVLVRSINYGTGWKQRITSKEKYLKAKKAMGAVYLAKFKAEREKLGNVIAEG